MSATFTSKQVMVTEKVFDLFFVNILNEKVLYQSFDYIIYGEGKRLCRKGRFRAPSVQIRTNDLKEGNYQFQLFLNGAEWESSAFEKCGRGV